MSAESNENVPPGEDAQIARLVEQSLTLMDKDTKPVLRGQHPKHHGCVRAEFVVESGLDADLRHGLFAKPGRYPTAIRFSNAAMTDDRKGDGHGMALKLFNVPGYKLLEDCQTHDFVLLDHPVFFAGDVAGYVELFDALIHAKDSVLPKLAFFLPRFIAEMGHVYMTYLRKHPEQLKIMLAMMAKQPATPLDQRYWSTTPYRLGPHVVRWSVQPHAEKLRPVAPADSPDKLRIALAQQLSEGEAAFDFMAQIRTNPDTMPIEDPTREWTGAPLRKLATMYLPKQKPDSHELMEFCEHLSFNVWRCLPDHEPLGGINRARRAIYEAVSKRRHELNGRPEHEPTATEFLALHQA
ncbi:MAG: catalase family protein [Planctomycetes bacterium]|nr:catalase family protein [Planctomycetota bacterium]